MSYPIITLKPGKEEMLQRFHPWIFSGALQNTPSNINEGEIVEVKDSKGNFQAIGHYQIGSIAVRVLSFTSIKIDEKFWEEKILNAYTLRKQLQLTDGINNNAYRLIHGEGDTLPGLIVDVYADTAVIQAHSIGMHIARKTIAELIVKTIHEVNNVFYKSENTLPFKAAIEPQDSYLIGGKSDMQAQENGLLFHADWIKGQKTGFFIDQRDNRSLLEKYSHNKSVLNMFCYTGGFSFYALRGGAVKVHSVDSSAKAIELTDKNIHLNFGEDIRHKSYAIDAFKFLEQMNSEDYDVIVLDPPAFAKHRAALRNALQGYKKLNAKAFEKIKPGGIVFTFSCSQVVSKEQFRLAVFSAAAISKRQVKILHQLTQPADHPINIYHPEGEYLKGLVLQVE